MQFSEQLADRQTAEAVRARIDWEYLLGLELTDSGFEFQFPAWKEACRDLCERWRAMNG